MPDVALRGLPPELHRALRAAAEQNHRSLNGEILARLQASVRPEPLDIPALLERSRVRGSRMGLQALTPDDIEELIDAGRS